jgi:hypothetical protein
MSLAKTSVVIFLLSVLLGITDTAFGSLAVVSQWAPTATGSLGCQIALSNLTGTTTVTGTTTKNHGLTTGDTITVAGCNPSTFNATGVVCTVLTATTFTYPATGGVIVTPGTVQCTTDVNLGIMTTQTASIQGFFARPGGPRNSSDTTVNKEGWSAELRSGAAGDSNTNYCYHQISLPSAQQSIGAVDWWSRFDSIVTNGNFGYLSRLFDVSANQIIYLGWKTNTNYWINVGGTWTDTDTTIPIIQTKWIEHRESWDNGGSGHSYTVDAMYRLAASSFNTGQWVTIYHTTSANSGNTLITWQGGLPNTAGSLPPYTGRYGMPTLLSITNHASYAVDHLAQTPSQVDPGQYSAATWKAPTAGSFTSTPTAWYPWFVNPANFVGKDKAGFTWSAGSDNNDGTSLSTPWLTKSKVDEEAKYNGFLSAAIPYQETTNGAPNGTATSLTQHAALFREEWRKKQTISTGDHLVVCSGSGSPWAITTPFTFPANGMMVLGDGEQNPAYLAYITGFQAVPVSGISNTTGNVYQFSEAAFGEYGVLRENMVRMIQAPNSGGYSGANVTYVANTPNSYVYDHSSTTYYFHTSDSSNPTTDGKSYVLGMCNSQDHLMILSGTSGVVQGLSLSGCQNEGDGAVVNGGYDLLFGTTTTGVYVADNVLGDYGSNHSFGPSGGGSGFSNTRIVWFNVIAQRILSGSGGSVFVDYDGAASSTDHNDTDYYYVSTGVGVTDTPGDLGFSGSTSNGPNYLWQTHGDPNGYDNITFENPLAGNSSGIAFSGTVNYGVTVTGGQLGVASVAQSSGVSTYTNVGFLAQNAFPGGSPSTPSVFNNCIFVFSPVLNQNWNGSTAVTFNHVVFDWSAVAANGSYIFNDLHGGGVASSTIIFNEPIFIGNSDPLFNGFTPGTDSFAMNYGVLYNGTNNYLLNGVSGINGGSHATIAQINSAAVSGFSATGSLGVTTTTWDPLTYAPTAQSAVTFPSGLLLDQTGQYFSNRQTAGAFEYVPASGLVPGAPIIQGGN